MKVSVTVPATSANLGPGFDCLGLALTLYNEIVLTKSDDRQTAVTLSGEGDDHIPLDGTNLVLQGMRHVFVHLKLDPGPLHIAQQNGIPVASGLGSSSAALVGGMLAANAWAGGGLSRQDILALATAIEGHPDNVAPALFGGLTLTAMDEDGLHLTCIDVPDLRIVIVLPDYDFLTEQARAALPAQVSRADAIFNLSHLGLLIEGLRRGNYDLIRRGMRDRLHQPHRAPLIPGVQAAQAAALAAGAVGVALSGAGPSLLAIAVDETGPTIAAMQREFASAGLASRAWEVGIDRQGSRVETAVVPG